MSGSSGWNMYPRGICTRWRVAVEFEHVTWPARRPKVLARTKHWRVVMSSCPGGGLAKPINSGFEE
eukprot:CAMPEP_0194525204 /NCGR_PEP_ID=MMETSP0253-20130528/60585_1 /TAXON_ID=2966 /ORGANISM="Noctiluca scintillans" /LENGTH=65 /DNA_ID=CAMNT_0039369903 /DNA_START=653 /DNA_END=850 /DNA_ORIENTATION=+